MISIHFLEMRMRCDIMRTVLVVCLLVRRLHSYDAAVTVSAGGAIETAGRRQPDDILDDAMQQHEVVIARAPKGIDENMISEPKHKFAAQWHTTSAQKDDDHANIAVTVSAGGIIDTASKRQRNAPPDEVLQQPEVVLVRATEGVGGKTASARRGPPQFPWHPASPESASGHSSLDMAAAKDAKIEPPRSRQSKMIPEEALEKNEVVGAHAVQGIDDIQTSVRTVRGSAEMNRHHRRAGSLQITAPESSETETSNFDRSRPSNRINAGLSWIRGKPAQFADFLSGLADLGMNEMFFYVTAAFFVMTGAIALRLYFTR